MRESGDLKCLNAGSAIPCVTAAPRATVVQKFSTSLGVTRMSSTGGEFSRYVDQLAKSVGEGMRAWSIEDIRMSRLLVWRSGWFAANTMTGVMKATPKSDAVS